MLQRITRVGELSRNEMKRTRYDNALNRQWRITITSFERTQCIFLLLKSVPFILGINAVSFSGNCVCVWVVSESRKENYGNLTSAAVDGRHRVRIGQCLPGVKFNQIRKQFFYLPLREPMPCRFVKDCCDRVPLHRCCYYTMENWIRHQVNREKKWKATGIFCSRVCIECSRSIKSFLAIARTTVECVNHHEW